MILGWALVEGMRRGVRNACGDRSRELWIGDGDHEVQTKRKVKDTQGRPEELKRVTDDSLRYGMLEFLEVGVSLEDIFAGENLDAGFVSGFLDTNSDYDNLRSLLQLNSFTNITNAEAVFNDPGTTLHLYHSEYDRLVPAANTDAFLEVLNGNVTSIHHSDECNSNNFRLIFEAIDKVGIIHTLCGLNMLDNVFAELRQ